jgi:hypothetical protein
MRSRVSIIIGLLASLTLLAHTSAKAFNRNAAIDGAVIGAVIADV